MVFKSLQKNSFDRLSFVFQLSAIFALTGLLFVLKEDFFSFLIGLIFSYSYIGLFFYSIRCLIIKEKRALGLTLLFAKWILLLGMLFLLSQYLSVRSFLIAITIIPVIAFSYAEKHYRQKENTK